MTIIAGTGNRELFHAEEKVMEQIKIRLQELHATKVISGMAIGFDQLLALSAFDLGIPVIAAVPFVTQATIWPKAAAAKYIEILEKCETVEVISPGEYKAYKMHVRNEWMVNHSDVLLAYSNKLDGGAVACIKYAEKLSKKVVNLFE